MIMSIFGLEDKIEFKENSVNIFEIYNKKLFCNLIDIINEKCNGEEDEDNQIVLLKDGDRIKIKNNMFIITDLFNIDFNSKKILNKLYNIITQNIKNKQDYELEEITLKLRNYIIEEINELPFEFNINSELEIADLLKIFNLKIDTTSYTTIIEKIEYIINLISTLKIANILVIPNLKIFLNEDELLEIYKYCIYNNIKLLVMENNAYEKILKYENKNIIDEEFDEF